MKIFVKNVQTLFGIIAPLSRISVDMVKLWRNWKYFRWHWYTLTSILGLGHFEHLTIWFDKKSLTFDMKGWGTGGSLPHAAARDTPSGQSEASIEVTWSASTNQRTVLPAVGQWEVAKRQLHYSRYAPSPLWWSRHNLKSGLIGFLSWLVPAVMIQSEEPAKSFLEGRYLEIWPGNLTLLIACSRDLKQDTFKVYHNHNP